MTKTVRTKLLISGATAALIVLLVAKQVEVQTGVVALAVLAILPWLSAVVDTMELPGVAKLKFREVEEKVVQQQKQLNVQQEIINNLVVYSMSWFIFDLLSKLYHRNREGGEYLFRNKGTMHRDFRFLRDHGYLEHFNIGDLHDGENLVGRIKLTPVGNYFVEVREQLRVRDAVEAAKYLVP
jgi:hypothetical protein